MNTFDQLPPFRTFFASQEPSAAPVIADILRCAKMLTHELQNDTLQASIAMSYGRRVAITQTAFLNQINRDHVIEIVDYDPIKQVMLVVGQQEPDQNAVLHWMTHYAREDIRLSVLLNDDTQVDHWTKHYTVVSTKQSSQDALGFLKEVLKTLRDTRAMIIPDKGLFLTGMTIQDIENEVAKIKKM